MPPIESQQQPTLIEHFDVGKKFSFKLKSIHYCVSGNIRAMGVPNNIFRQLWLITGMDCRKMRCSSQPFVRRILNHVFTDTKRTYPMNRTHHTTRFPSIHYLGRGNLILCVIYNVMWPDKMTKCLK